MRVGWKRVRVEEGEGDAHMYQSPAYVNHYMLTHVSAHCCLKACTVPHTHLHNVWVCDPSQQGNLSGHNSHLLVLHPAIREDARLAEELYHNLDIGQDEGKRDEHLRTSRHKKGGEKVEGKAGSRAARSCTSQL